MKYYKIILPILLAVLPLLVQCDDSCPGLPKCFCSKDKTSVNCDGKKFTELPDSIPMNVTKLFLKYNDIVNISSGAIRQYKKLEKLDLTRNKITKIQPNAFAYAVSLKYIDLRENKLATIGPYAFSHLPELKEIYLMTNRIEIIDDTAFDGTEMLKFITLQSNSLKVVPSLGKQPKLQKIVLQGNKINNATIPKSFAGSKGLHYIGLSSNRIEILDGGTFANIKNVTISSLYLSDNKIRAIQKETFLPFTGISSLKIGQNPLNGTMLKTALDSIRGKSMASLDISGLNLNGQLLQDTFKSLLGTTIKSLDMRYNAVPTLESSSFNGLSGLLQLDLSNCQIAETEFAAFLGLDKLQILNMAKNKLIVIPENLPYSLRRLYLDDNQIHSMGSIVFKRLVYLEELRIRNNKVQTLMKDSFHGLISLDKLDLRNNQISTLPAAVFDPLVRLTELNIARNNLFTIQHALKRFSSLGSLVYFNMADNQCSDLQLDLFHHMVSLKYLHLENNKLGSLIEKDEGGLLFRALLKLEELHLMDNGIVKLQDHVFQDLNSLVKLNLTNNRLSTWSEDLFKFTPRLKSIDLTNNLISVLSAENLGQLASLVELNLTGNPFHCGCELRWFRHWLNETKVRVTNVESFICVQSGQWSDKPLMEFDVADIDCLLFSWRGMTTQAIFVLSLALYIYKKRWRIKLSYHKWKYGNLMRRRRDEAALEKKYDGYISSAEDDRLWVIDNLLNGIDNGQLDDDHAFGGDFTMYFDERDAEPGRTKFDNMHENMIASRKVIIVMSQSYLSPDESYNHHFEIDQALMAMYEKLIEEIIIVYLERGLPNELLPAQLAISIRRHKLLEWSEDENARELFKRQLIERLQTRVNAATIDAD